MQVGAQVQWEWQNRLGQSHPITIYGPEPIALWPLTVHTELADLNLAGIERIWLFHSDRDMTALLEYLETQGFTRRTQAKPFLLLLEKTSNNL